MRGKAAHGAARSDPQTKPPSSSPPATLQPPAGEYQLAMGALTGAGMFVGAVVAGRIITLSGGVRARGAQLRDIGTQLITVAVVMGIGEAPRASRRLPRKFRRDCTDLNAQQQQTRALSLQVPASALC